jgi:hypothetical protein
MAWLTKHRIVTQESARMFKKGTFVIKYLLQQETPSVE